MYWQVNNAVDLPVPYIPVKCQDRHGVEGKLTFRVDTTMQAQHWFIFHAFSVKGLLIGAALQSASFKIQDDRIVSLSIYCSDLSV